MDIISEILKCFLCLEKNVNETVEYIKEYKKIKVTKRTFSLAFKESRDIIYRYLELTYQTELLGDLSQGGYFSVDESLFRHSDNAQIWILGIIDTSSKEFRLERYLSRNSEILKKFISKFAKSGNTIISDHWIGYDFLDRMDSGHSHIKFNHGMGQFGFSLTSTSHIGDILGDIETKNKINL